jgi:hypothetical protein
MREKLLLSKEEHLPGIALSLIGIELPQEYQLMVYSLIQLAKKKGLGNITVDDAVEVKNYAMEELVRREKVANENLIFIND